MWGTDYQLLSPSFRTQSYGESKRWVLVSLHFRSSLEPAQCSGTTLVAEVLAHTPSMAEGRHSWHASHGPTKPSMVCRPWQESSLPPSLPTSLLQSLGTRQHPGITSAPCSCEGGLLGWASSFPWQMNLMGRMCLQNTLSLIHPLWSSQKTLPEDLTFPCLPWRNFGTQSDPIRPTSGASSFTSLSFAFFLPSSLFKFNLTRQFTTFFTALHLVEPHLCMQNASKSKC